MLSCAPQYDTCFFFTLLKNCKSSTTLTKALCASSCNDAGEAAASARRLSLNIAVTSQTEWCHRWADVLHNNGPPMWCLLKKKNWLIRTNQLTGSDVKLGTVTLLCVWCGVCVAMPAVVDLCVFVPVLFDSLSWLHPLPTDSLRVLIFHTHFNIAIIISSPPLSPIHQVCSKEHENCLNKLTGPCVCRRGFKNFKLLDL